MRNSMVVGGVKTIKVSVRQDMEAYDALPEVVRRALSGARFMYSAVPILEAFGRGMPAEALVGVIRRKDEELATRART